MSYPIDDILPTLLERLRTHPRLVLEAPPGAGKTTQVPLALLGASWCTGKILMLEPRRVAARAAAQFMAQQLGQAVGDTVGYRIRFEQRISATTRIEVLTEGILTRMLQDDPTLDGVSAILFDEFHERHLAGDLGLALALDIHDALRDDLRLVVMSATLDGAPLARLLDAQHLSSAGRSFAVTTHYVPPRQHDNLTLRVRRCLEQALAQHPGDVLVFLPGRREIAQLESSLHAPPFDALELLPLHGDLAVEQQNAALAPNPQGRRRIVLATNLAESSVTLPGVRIVVDTGLAREPRVDPNSGFSRLETVSISQASADQRAGRAGRVAAGWCYRLWPREQRLDPVRRPEIQQVDLSGLALELAAWGSAELRFVDPPPAGTLAAARDLLQKLGALDAQLRLSPLGTRMLTLGTHPRLAAMLLATPDGDSQALACDLAALLEARDPLQDNRSDDWYSRWQALAAFRRNDQNTAALAGASHSAVAAIDRSARQWRQRLRLGAAPPIQASARELGELLLHAYPDRIARQHPGDRLRYQLSNGRSARLHENSPLIGEPWLAISELRHANRDGLVLRAAPLDEAQLRQTFPERFSETDVVRWDDTARALVARRESRYDQILLATKPAGRPDPEQAAQALCDAVAHYGSASLPWTEALRQWQARVVCLRTWMPALQLPDVSDAALLANRERWLLPLFHGQTRLDSLGSAALAKALEQLLDWTQRQALDQHAPARILVPSGLERTIHYTIDQEPVLAIKLQELFGLAQTPRIASGRVALTLHLLSPGGKPLQITQDLASFWQRTYPDVRKEMKGRYPKHPWPDDPWHATATHRAKPRGT